MKEIKLTEDYEVLTPNGFKPFHGVRKTYKEALKITFKDGTSIICSYNHKFYENEKFVTADTLKIGDILSNKTISSIEDIGKSYLYDLLEVDDGHVYTANDIAVSNCAFVPKNIWKEFFNSVFPTISSGKESKLIVVSCVTGSTLVYTEYGIRKVKDFFTDKIDSLSSYQVLKTNTYSILGKDKSREGNILVYSGKQKTKLIDTEYSSIECSHEHKFLTKSDSGYIWKKASDLSSSDILYVQKGFNLWGNSEKYSKDVLYLLGLFLLNDGTTYNNYSFVITSNFNIHEILSNYTYYTFDNLHYTIEGETIIEIINSFQFNKFSINLPTDILSLKKELMIAFLQPMFDEKAFYNGEYLSIYFFKTQRNIANQIRVILLNFGILSKVFYTKDYTSIRLYGDNIQIFLDEIGFRFNNKISIPRYDYFTEEIIETKIISISDSEDFVYDFSLNESSDFYGHSVIYNGLIGHQTPNGKNHFYDFWIKAKTGESIMYPLEVNWWDVPGRDDKWKQEMLQLMTEEEFNVEYGNSFDSSTGTLISQNKFPLLEKNIIQPINSTKVLKIYEKPKEDRIYFASVDCASTGIDFAAIVIFDITEIPYREVAIYKDDTIPVLSFPQIIFSLCSKYYNAEVLVESNDIGNTVLHILNYELEYDNITRTKSGNSRKSQLGQRTTAHTKASGCTKLKDLIEQGEIIIRSKETLDEFRFFVLKGQSYQAVQGYHDDLVMCYVNFAHYMASNSFRVKYNIEMIENVRRQMVNYANSDTFRIKYDQVFKEELDKFTDTNNSELSEDEKPIFFTNKSLNFENTNNGLKSFDYNNNLKDDDFFKE